MSAIRLIKDFSVAILALIVVLDVALSFFYKKHTTLFMTVARNLGEQDVLMSLGIALLAAAGAYYLAYTNPPQTA